MTKSKARRLINELIRQYGDVVVAKTYDYWASKTYVHEGEDTNTVIKEIHLSEIDVPTAHRDFNHIVDIVVGKTGIDFIPVYIDSSKEVYDSPEQTEYRRIAKKNHDIRMKQYINYLAYIPKNIFI